MNIFVTGANGFIGKNLVARLASASNVQVFGFDQENTPRELEEGLATADFIFHLAGVNRPETVDEFHAGNVDLTAQICDQLLAMDRSVPILFASSTQAVLNNPYGVSKRAAEGVMADYAQRSGAAVFIYRLTNVFGKWCRPNYNSVVATFCHNIARDLPITISDRSRKLTLVYIEDVLRCFLVELNTGQAGGVFYREAEPNHNIILGALADLIYSFRAVRQTLQLPDFSDAFTHKLYSTYIAYLEGNDFAYDLDQKCDPRGCLAEFVKAAPFGQIFVSRTKPGITRGNHYHHLKTEKFLVLEGEAIIRFRHIRGNEVLEYHICGEDFRVVDIPPGYTHSIENVGASELITLFWASEIFDPQQPDTVYRQVLS